MTGSRMACSHVCGRHMHFARIWSFLRKASRWWYVNACCGIGLVAGCSSDAGVDVANHLPQPYFPAHKSQMPPQVHAMRSHTEIRAPVRQAVAATRRLPASVAPPGGISREWKYIVVHHSATHTGGARRFHRSHKFNNGWEHGLGYHFVIGNGTDTPQGVVEVGHRWTKQLHGAHCKTPDNRYNDRGIGICLVGNFENAPPSAAQMETLAGLVWHLMNACDIPPSRLYTHGGLTHRTACPGSNFSLPELKRRIGALAVR